MEVENAIKSAVAEALGLKTEDVEVDRPDNPEFGDYTTNAVMQTFSAKEEILRQAQNDKTDSRIVSILSNSKNPRELAKKAKETLSKDEELSQYISNIEVAGPGFINFWLNTETLESELKRITEDENYGKPDIGKGKKVIVEYSSPNIAKPFNIGHMRSSVIGDAIANFMEKAGYEVLRDNHLGDWGTQFGKQIYAIKTWGDEEAIESSDNPVKELVKLYVRFHKEAEENPEIVDKGREWFKKLEDGDSEARRIWKLCIEWSWQEFERIYEILGIEFSDEFEGGRGLGESFFEEYITEAVKALEEKGMLKEGEEGAKLVFFENDKYSPAMILKKDGSTLYHTRDLATDLYRKKQYDPDLIINEVGSEQTLYFRRLFEMESLLGWFKKEQRVHVAHGLVRLKDSKMSTRKGNVIWLNDVLEEAVKRAKDLGSSDEIAQMVAVGAIKWNDLKRDPLTEIVFDWDEILNMEGNSGPYMQYTYARANSVLKKAKDEGMLSVKNEVESLSIPEEVSGEEMELARFLTRYKGEIVRVVKNYSPNLMANYLYSLAQKFNTFYNKHQIVGGDNQAFRLALTSVTVNVIQSGLKLLGIDTPEEM